jgi:hypothetical protein
MTETLTETPSLPTPDGITSIGDWHEHGSGDHAHTVRHFVVREVAIPLSFFTYMTWLTVGGEQFADGEIVSYVAIPDDIVVGSAPESWLVDYLADEDRSLLSVTDALDLAESLEHLTHTDELCCTACNDEAWAAAKALRYAAEFLRDWRELNRMAPHDEGLT